MKALVVDSPGRLFLGDIAVPELTEFDALVRTRVCGICNSTDSKLIAGTMPYHSQYPAILGHESIGEVVAVGGACRTFRKGMRVTRTCALFPGETKNGLTCAWGGFAEYALVRDRFAAAAEGHTDVARNDWLLRQGIVPDGISDVEAALAISLSEIVSWMQKLGSMRGLNVVVVGTGIAGLAMCWFAKNWGAAKVVVLGRRPERLAKARMCGADDAFLSGYESVAAVRNSTDGGANLVLEAAGSADALNVGLACLVPGGEAAIYGVTEEYVYQLALKSAPPNFVLRVPQPEEHLTYHWVCDKIARREIPVWQFVSHEWKGPEEAVAAFGEVAQGRVLKGFVRFS